MPKKNSSFRFLFVSDPLENFDPVAETTLYLMREAVRRGHRVYYTEPRYLTVRGSKVYVRFAQVHPQKNKKQWLKKGNFLNREITYFDGAFLRKDPPFDLEYLHHLYLLELASNDLYLMNHPSGIMVGNEKLLPLPFQERIPETVITAQKDELLGFLKKQPQGIILKPLGEAGGRGILYLQWGHTDNLAVLLEMATGGFTQHVLAQKYLPHAKKGDKRILLLGSEVLGAFTRLPAPGEYRANLHAGGKAVPAKLNKQDLELVGLIRPALMRMGLDFVGLDVIGDSLIEVNVTSPMGLHELNQTGTPRSERRVMDFVEEQVRARKI